MKKSLAQGEDIARAMLYMISTEKEANNSLNCNVICSFPKLSNSRTD